jgi:hypothetical protein
MAARAVRLVLLAGCMIQAHTERETQFEQEIELEQQLLVVQVTQLVAQQEALLARLDALLRRLEQRHDP